MGIFDRFKKTKDIEKEPKVEKKAPKKKPESKKKKAEQRLFDPSLVPSGKEEKPKAEKQKKEAKDVKEKTKEKTKKEKKEDTGEAYRVLIKPLVTEKSTSLGVYSKYVFKVASKVSKIEIKKAIHDLYGVEVIKVNIVNQGGKPIQYGRSSGRTGSWKKAVITLKPGEKIEIYEGV